MTFQIDVTRGKRIAILSAPVVIAMFTQTLINVVDTIFVGKLAPSYSIPGQSALGFSLPILWAIGGFLAALGVGTQAMTARRRGAGDPLGAGVVLANSLVVAGLSSVLFTALGWLVVPAFFKFLTSNESVVALGVPYARLRILGVLAMVMTTGYKGFFDGIGSTRVHMYAALLMNGANVVLNYVFIFGAGPIEPHYVSGAAIASLIATYIGLSVMIVWSLRHKYSGPHRYYWLENLRPAVMREIVRLSAPSGAAQVFVMAGVLMFLKIVGLLDARAVEEALQQSPLYAGEAWRVARSSGLLGSDWSLVTLSARPPIYTAAAKLIVDLLSIGFVTCIALGTATATLVSSSMGERKFALAEAYGWDSVKIGMYVFGLAGAVVVLFPEVCLDLLSDDRVVIEAAVPGLRVMASLQVLIATALILTQALFGAGDTKFVMYVELVLHGVCLAPLAWLFALHLDLGFLGVWLSATAYTVALAAMMSWRFWRGHWKRIEV